MENKNQNQKSNSNIKNDNENLKSKTKNENEILKLISDLQEELEIVRRMNKRTKDYIKELDYFITHEDEMINEVLQKLKIESVKEIEKGE